MANGIGLTNDGVSYLTCTTPLDIAEDAVERATKDYNDAIKEHNAEFLVYNPVHVAYTDSKLAIKDRPTDEEYIAARTIYREAVAKFDKAEEAYRIFMCVE